MAELRSGSIQFGVTSRLAILGVIVSAQPLLLRSLALFETRLAWSRCDLRGVAQDLLIGLLLATLAWVVSRRWPGSALVVLLPWLLVNLANHEHVLVFQAPVGISHAGYLLDPSFFWGSAVGGVNPVLLLTSLAGAVVATAVIPRGRVGAWPWALVIVSGSTLVAFERWWPQDLYELRWRQGHPFVLELREGIDAASDAAMPVDAGAAAEVQQHLRPDLSAELRFPLPTSPRHNVVLVMVESISGAHLPSLAQRVGLTPAERMPRLDALASRALTARTFIAPQRQTNRGEYALLCGDLPKLAGGSPKMTEIALAGEPRECLPALLGRQGYRTSYLQAAQLRFMLKDRFMPLIGFERVSGAELFDHRVGANGWGVDDRVFFATAADHLAQLDRGDDPYFAALLTVGTHHPYDVPQDFRPPDSTGFSRAVAFADIALAEFVDRLEADGLLDDTILIITSDESAGTTGTGAVAGSLLQNWAPLVVLAPGGLGAGAVIDEPYLQSDLAVSVLDYLGMHEVAPALQTGRSIFRRYATPRPIYFANTISGGVWTLRSDGHLYTCNANLRRCSGYSVDPALLFKEPVPAGGPDKSVLREWSAMLQVVDAPEGGARGMEGSLRLAQDGQEVRIQEHELPGELIIGGQYMQVPPGAHVSVDIDVQVTLADPGISVRIMQDLYSPEGVWVGNHLPPLFPGDEAKIRFSRQAQRRQDGVEVRMFAAVEGDGAATLRLARAEVRMDMQPPPAAPAMDEAVQVIRADEAGPPEAAGAGE